MTKAKKNSVVGVRTVWSMHNDNTWRKSNLIGDVYKRQECPVFMRIFRHLSGIIEVSNQGRYFYL